MLSVGQQIREQRLRLGLKLEEISARSRISLKTLQAIETDDLAALSAPFLYRSFVRQFAEHVKLDYSQIASAVDSAALSMPQPLVPGEGDAGKTNIAPLRIKERQKSFRWLYSIGSLCFMVVACSSVYGVWQNSKSNWRKELSGLTHSADSAQPSQPPPTAAASGIAPAPVKETARVAPHSVRPATARTAPANQEDSVAAADPQPAASAQQDSPEFRVELSAIERTWISIVQDGKQTFNGTLDPEQTKVLEGHDTARIRTGNAGGISCVFNGKSIGTVGPRGQVRTVVFTKDNYEVLDASTPIALAQFPSIVE